MELILQVRADSPVMTLPDKKLVRFYFYLLSCAVEYNGEWCADHFDHDKYKAELKALDKEGFIVIDGDDVFVLSEKGVLLANKVHPFVQEKQLLKQYHEDVTKRRNRIRVAGVDQWLQLLPSLDAYKVTLREFTDVIRVWEQAIGLIHEETTRRLTGKEIGQFKQFHKTYGAVTCTKMIIRYMLQSSSPNIGHLLTIKDNLYYETQRTDKNTAATGDNSAGFF